MTMGTFLANLLISLEHTGHLRRLFSMNEWLGFSEH